MAVSGRLIGGVLVGCGIAAGAAMYWFQVYAFYDELDPASVSLEVTDADGAIREVAATDIRAITATSSPIRFRACFTLTAPDAVLEGAAPAEDAVPLNAPGWFDCFDAAGIGADLAAGRAVALLGRENVEYGIDRVLAVYPDGRAVAWHQINRCGEEVFDGNPAPLGCPVPPG